MSNTLEIRFHYAPWKNGYEVVFFDQCGGKTFIGAPVVMAEKKSRIANIEPTAMMSYDAMQGLFNELWKAGFRPKDGSGNTSTIEALHYHLEDMRRLVFGESKKPEDAA